MDQPLNSHKHAGSFLNIVVSPCVCVCFLPIARKKVDVVSATLPPVEADAGDILEGEQCIYDDVSLFSGCRHKNQQIRNVPLRTLEHVCRADPSLDILGWNLVLVKLS